MFTMLLVMLVMMMLMMMAVVETRVVFLHKDTRQDAVLRHYLKKTSIPSLRVIPRDEAGSPRYLGTPWHHGRERTAIFDPNCGPTERNFKLLANSGRLITDTSLSPDQASQNPTGQQKSRKSIIRTPGVTWDKNVGVNGLALKNALVGQTPPDGIKGSKGTEMTPGVTMSTNDGRRGGQHSSFPDSDGSDVSEPRRQGSRDVEGRPGVPWRTVDGGRFPSSTMNRETGVNHSAVHLNDMMDFIGTLAAFNRRRAGSGAPIQGRIHSHGQWPGHSHVLTHSRSLRGPDRQCVTHKSSPFIVQRLLLTPKEIPGALFRTVEQSHPSSPLLTREPTVTTRQIMPETRGMSDHTPTASGLSTNENRNRQINGINQSLGSVEEVNINRATSISRAVMPFEITTTTPFEMSNAKPFAVRTATHLEAFTASPFEVRTGTSLVANTVTPSEKRNTTRFETSSDKPFEVKTTKSLDVKITTPLEASLAKPFQVRTAHPEVSIATSLEVKTATPFDVNTSLPPEVITATALGTQTATPFQGSTVPNSVQSSILPSTISPSSTMTPTADVEDGERRQFEGLVVGTSGTLASNALLHERLSSQWQSLGQRMQEIADRVNGGWTVTQQTRKPETTSTWVDVTPPSFNMSVRVPDDGGDEMTLFSWNGNIYPNFQNKMAVRNLPNVKIRSDDVLLCAYPKSGTHWLWEITRLLLAGQMDTDNISKMANMIEFANEDDYKDLPSPRILNTHVVYKNLPKDVQVKKPKILYLTRNPKDIAVSYYSFVKQLPFQDYSGEWKNYVRPLFEGRFDFGSWFDYVKDWEEVKKTTDLAILSMNYEDLKQDTSREAKRVCKFLGLERSDEFITQVCEQCQFESLKKVKATAAVTGDIAYRKGEVGDWKNWFTVAQNEWFDKFYEEKMADCPLTFTYTAD